MRWSALGLATVLAATAAAAATARRGSAAEAAPRVVLLGIAVEARPGYARVTEVVHLRNDTSQTLRVRVSFPLPEGARFITFHEGLQRPAVRGTDIVDEIEIRPGLAQVVYAYTIAGGRTLPVERRFPRPIERIEVFATSPAEVRSPELRPAPAVERNGRIYTRATSERIPAGPLAMTITGVPPLRRWPAPVAAATLAGLLAAGLAWAVAAGRSSRAYRA